MKQEFETISQPQHLLPISLSPGVAFETTSQPCRCQHLLPISVVANAFFQSLSLGVDNTQVQLLLAYISFCPLFICLAIHISNERIEFKGIGTGSPPIYNSPVFSCFNVDD